MRKFIWITAFFVGLISCTSNEPKSTPESATATVKPRSILVNGVELNYIDLGKGTPVIFVHGTLGDYRTWGAEMDTFSKDHRVIAYSRRYAYPNKQEINDSADYTAIPHSKDLAEFIKALNVGPVHLVGHSYGAFTALLTTIDHPELVKSLTLGEPPVMSLLANVKGGDMLISKFVSNSITPAAAAFKSNQNEKAVRVFVSGVVGDTAFFSKIPPEGQDIMMANTLELRGAVFSKNLFTPVSCETLKNIQTPVLLMHGDRSPPLFKTIINELERCLPNKEKVILPNSSHGLEFDNPQAFNEVVLRFIDKH